ncbi:MAG: hypothetical protein KGS45_13820 [Planctomycetes bacterium]|nr:hypothetical protein [Planctomycetota bacterium]
MRNSITPFVLAFACAGIASANSCGMTRSERPADPAASPTVPSSTPATWYEPAATFTVATHDLDLADAVRAKTLPLRIRFPKGSTEPLPVIIFSHGAGGSREAFPDLSEFWTARGYVVIHPTHSDSIQLRRQNGENLERLRTDLKSLKSDVKPLDRLADVKLILDSLADLEKTLAALPEGKGLMLDAKRIAIAGHSAGALTTQMAIGVKVRGGRAGAGALIPTNVGDDRIVCGVVISGQGLTNRMMTKESWSELEKPMLVITGSKDVARISDETPESRRHPYEYAKPGDKYLLFMEGATHSSYQGKVKFRAIEGDDPDDATLTMITRSTGSTTLAFLDAYVKKNDAAKAYLASGAIPKVTEGKATLDHK